MRKLAVLSMFCVAAFVGAAQAEKPPHPAHPAHPAHPEHPAHPPHPGDPGNPKQPHAQRCVARDEGYNSSGTLVKASLSPAAGSHRYNGTIEAIVTRANHRGPTGDQTFTLTDTRVVVHPGVDASAPAPGSRVGLHGTITELPRGCSTVGFSPTVTIRKVDVRKPGLAKS